jgi:hypothetical protein
MKQRTRKTGRNGKAGRAGTGGSGVRKKSESANRLRTHK